MNQWYQEGLLDVDFPSTASDANFYAEYLTTGKAGAIDITYQDILGTDADELENTVIRRVTAEKVQQVLHRLPARERFVLELRYGLTDGRQHPQHEIARRLGISRSYVSRVEKKAVALLRDEIER